jgi:hypothetical protein
MFRLIIFIASNYKPHHVKKFLLFVLLISGCSTIKNDDNVVKSQIEKDIQQNAMGQEIGYVPGRLDTVIKVNVGLTKSNFKKVWDVDFPNNYKSADSLLKAIVERARQSDNAAIFKYFNTLAARVKYLSSAKDTDADYIVCRYNYKVNNVLDENRTKTDVTNYYYFDHRDSLIGKRSDLEMEMLKNEFFKTKTLPYEFGLSQITNDN